MALPRLTGLSSKCPTFHQVDLSYFNSLLRVLCPKPRSCGFSRSNPEPLGTKRIYAHHIKKSFPSLLCFQEQPCHGTGPRFPKALALCPVQPFLNPLVFSYSHSCSSLPTKDPERLIQFLKFRLPVAFLLLWVRGTHWGLWGRKELGRTGPGVSEEHTDHSDVVFLTAQKPV